MTDDALPWLDPVLDKFRDVMAAGRMPHAILVEGPVGSGKSHFAAHIAGALLCQAGDSSKRPCGRCRSCVFLAAGTHPDLHRVVPDEDKTGIMVDQIRALTEQLSLTGHSGDTRIGIIQPADFMNKAAANSLLKTLEEPGSGTVLLLLCADPPRLPQTIRSRCQSVRLANPDRKTALDWLSTKDSTENWTPLLTLAAGSPLRALALQKDGLTDMAASLEGDLIGIVRGTHSTRDVAAEWSKSEPRLRLDWLYTQVLDLARLKAEGGIPRSDLQKAGRQISLKRLTSYAATLQRSCAVFDAVNKKIALEGLLIPWTRGLEERALQYEAERL